ncbi:hypothetical protein [Flavobacterium sp.]|uniref:hypothetical protein n=1 Tax=Flavobacterium sp. TaxID=239 RepID=UPI0040479425
MQQKLNLLIDKKFNYKDKIITITKWKKVGTTYVVFSDKQTYNFFESEIDLFIDNLIPVRVKLKEGVLEKRQLELKNMENTPNTPNTLSEKKNDLTDILYDTINKVKEDKNYIGQANAICNVVSQMINIKKLELQLARKGGFKTLMQQGQ